MIDLTKTYKTKDGNPARFLAQIKSDVYPLIFAISDRNGDECVQSYSTEGNFYGNGTESDDDLVEYNPWKDLPIDAPIYVRQSETDGWVTRHFAGVSPNGLIEAFANGRTSFTKDLTDTVFWNHAKLKDEA